MDERVAREPDSARRECPLEVLSTLLPLLGVYVCAAALVGAGGLLLPGIEAWWDVPSLAASQALALVLGMAVVWVSAVTATQSANAGVWRHIGTVHAHLARAWGLCPNGHGVRKIVTGSALVAVLALLFDFQVLLSIAISSSESDPRLVSTQDAPDWSRAVFFATFAVGWEEIAFRGLPLVALYAFETWWPNQITAKRLTMASLGAASVVVFALLHLDVSASNFLAALVFAALTTAAVLITRSLWTGLLAHCAVNASLFLA